MKPIDILFLCTGNSARSILAEAIVSRIGPGRLRGFSAGSRPTGKPNPDALDLLAWMGYETAGFRSKSWNEFAGAKAPEMDLIITVCNNAAGETCPIWPGHPTSGHWGLPDPAAVAGAPTRRRMAFLETYARLSDRIGRLAALPLEQMSTADIRRQVAEIGALTDAGMVAA